MENKTVTLFTVMPTRDGKFQVTETSAIETEGTYKFEGRPAALGYVKRIKKGHPSASLSRDYAIDVALEVRRKEIEELNDRIAKLVAEREALGCPFLMRFT